MCVQNHWQHIWGPHFGELYCDDVHHGQGAHNAGLSIQHRFSYYEDSLNATQICDMSKTSHLLPKAKCLGDKSLPFKWRYLYFEENT